MERRVSHLCHHVLAPGCPSPRRLSPLCSDVPCTCPEGTSGLSAAAGSQGASVPSARSVAAALGNAARVYLAVLPGGHRAACDAGLPPHPVPSRGPSHSVEEEIQPLTMTIRPPHLPRVSLSAQWGCRCFVHLRAGPRPSRPCAGLLGRGLHAAGGGSPPHPQDVALPAAGCSLVPLAALCSCLGFRTSPLGAGPGGRALSGTWHLPVVAHLLSTPSASSPQLVSLLLLRGSHRTCSGLAGRHGPESAPPPTTGDAPNCLPAGSWSPSSPFGFLYTQRPLAAPGSSRCSRPRPLSAGP